MKTRALIALLAIAGAGVAAYKAGYIDDVERTLQALQDKLSQSEKMTAEPAGPPLPVVSVASAVSREFVETVMVTGSLVAREEILAAPEVEGLRIVELKVDEGDYVKKGDVLAVLESESLEAQLAQSDASLARATAAISQAESKIVETQARLAESESALERARPLLKSKYLAPSVFDEREAAAKTAAAQLTSARDGLKLAEAEKVQAEAQRRELLWRRGNTKVRSPADGLVSRRGARVGAIAIGAFVAGGGEPLFRLIANGEIELDADVTAGDLHKVAFGQTARVEVPGKGEVAGSVRLVAPEVEKQTRLGRVRIFLGHIPELKIGTFARALVETARATGLAVPQSAVLYGDRGASVQVVEAGKVVKRPVTTGLREGDLVEVKSGLAAGELVVAKAGTFLRDGDGVRAVPLEAKVSEAGP